MCLHCKIVSLIPQETLANLDLDMDQVMIDIGQVVADLMFGLTLAEENHLRIMFQRAVHQKSIQNNCRNAMKH